MGWCYEIMKSSEVMIAPCGINCSVCIAHMRDKKKCPGCQSLCVEGKPFHCTKCRIKYCDEHSKAIFSFCFDCPKFPCLRMRNLDKRYSTKYRTSIISNLKVIQEQGIVEFIKAETNKWVCPYCGEKLSIHRDFCLKCKKAVSEH